MPKLKLRGLLEQGHQTWNHWREQHSDILPDLRAGFDANFDLTDHDLSHLNLSRMDFQGARLARHKPASHFYETNFQNANLSRALISKSVFHGADLGNANLSGAQLFQTRFWQGTNLIRTNLSEAKLDGADFSGARLGWTVFGATDLSRVGGLDKASIEGPITIGLDTVYRSQGRIPKTFLKHAQIPDDAISFIQSHTGTSTKYRSCFISYSARNQIFADQLYTDLTNAGVFCWLAKQSLNTGENFEQKIVEAIKSFDSFVVLLSKQSLDSRWVEKEVRLALAEEGNRANFVLPIFLDDAYKKSKKRWVIKVRSKHITGFKTRAQSQQYFEALQKLLDALRSQENASSD